MENELRKEKPKRLKKMLERFANLTLVLMIVAKASLVFLVPLWLVGKVFGSPNFVWWIENLGAGFVGTAIGLYLIFCWFLPDDSAQRERVQAERTKRYAAFVQTMERPEYWRDDLQVVLPPDMPALTAALRAEGLHAGQETTMARFLARKAVESKFREQGFTIHEIRSADVRAAAQAMFVARADALIAEAKTRFQIDALPPNIAGKTSCVKVEARSLDESKRNSLRQPIRASRRHHADSRRRS